MPQQYDEYGNPVGRQPGDAGAGPTPEQSAEFARQAAERREAARVAALTPEQREAERIEAERKRLIGDLRRIAEGGGQAYGTTMRQVGQGNARIAALASGGKGGLNARLNASNAQATNKSAGHQQALQNKAAEISQARSAMGQVIAGAQDNAVQQGQDTLAALKQQYSNVQPDQAQRYVGMAGQVGQAAWSAYGNQESGPTRQRGDSASDWSNRQNNW